MTELLLYLWSYSYLLHFCYLFLPWTIRVWNKAGATRWMCCHSVTMETQVATLKVRLYLETCHANTQDVFLMLLHNTLIHRWRVWDSPERLQSNEMVVQNVNFLGWVVEILCFHKLGQYTSWHSVLSVCSHPASLLNMTFLHIFSVLSTWDQRLAVSSLFHIVWVE